LSGRPRARCRTSTGSACRSSRSRPAAIWADFEPGLDDLALARRASDQGIFIAPGTVFSPDRQQTRPGMRVNIAYGDDARLMRFLHDMLPRRRQAGASR
jgi:DNA-binding transcriptional MocR family regulator